MDTVGKGEGGSNWESSNGNIYIAICKTDSKWEFAIWHRGIAQLVKDLPVMQETPQFYFQVGKIPWSREKLPTLAF